MTDDDPIREHGRAILADFRSALVFLTSAPGRFVGQGPERPDFKQAARVFPFVGALVGIAGGLVIVIGAALGLPPLVVAALAVAVTVIVTGGLHEDGLADTADGFGGGATAERKLEIMGDSRIGAFGAVALILTLIVRVAALAALMPAGAGRAAAVQIAAEAVSRAAMVRLWHELPSARPGSMSEGTGPPDQQAMLVALIAGLVIVALAIVPTLGFWAAFWGIVAATAAAFGFARLTAHQIGGRTGDTLGACQQCTLVAFLAGVTPFA